MARTLGVVPRRVGPRARAGPPPRPAGADLWRGAEAGRAAGEGRVLIVCPASLRINWEREIRMVYPDTIVGMAGEDRISALYGCHWVIANYERLGGLVREIQLEFQVMAVDEAHYLKEHQAGRTRNAFVMATRIPRRYVITGTPLCIRYCG